MSLCDCSHGIVSSSVGPEYYVGILSFVDKPQLEPGCSVLMHNKVKTLSIMAMLKCLAGFVGGRHSSR